MSGNGTEPGRGRGGGWVGREPGSRHARTRARIRMHGHTHTTNDWLERCPLVLFVVFVCFFKFEGDTNGPADRSVQADHQGARQVHPTGSRL